MHDRTDRGWVRAGLAVVVTGVLGGGVLAVASGTKDSRKVTAEGVAATKASQPVTAAPVAPSGAPMESAAAEPPKADPTVGDKVVMGGDGGSVTVSAVEDGVSAGRLFGAGEGFKFIAAEVKGCSGPNEKKITFEPAYFLLRLDDGTVRDPGPGAKKPSLEGGMVPAGKCLSGWVTFTAPEGALATGVVYDGSVRTTWTVPLPKNAKQTTTTTLKPGATTSTTAEKASTTTSTAKASASTSTTKPKSSTAGQSSGSTTTTAKSGTTASTGKSTPTTAKSGSTTSTTTKSGSATPTTEKRDPAGRRPRLRPPSRPRPPRPTTHPPPTDRPQLSVMPRSTERDTAWYQASCSGSGPCPASGATVWPAIAASRTQRQEMSPARQCSPAAPHHARWVAAALARSGALRASRRCWSHTCRTLPPSPPSSTGTASSR